MDAPQFKHGDRLCNQFCPQFLLYFIGLSVVDPTWAVLETESGNVETNKLDALIPYPKENA